ncbi:hypothetical protein C8R44DRAFT_745255 [Mycena epipterygia]|nr:hypothetical protein C8R44DRAFT_745255 [Mycena epipterygia]
MYQSLLGQLDRSLVPSFAMSVYHSPAVVPDQGFQCDGMGTITTFSLNRSYDFTDIGDKRTVAETYSVVPLACTTNLLVFLKKAYPRSTPFIQHEISAIAVPAQSLTLESMNDLNALPILFNNDIQVDVEDGVMHTVTS